MSERPEEVQSGEQQQQQQQQQQPAHSGSAADPNAHDPGKMFVGGLSWETTEKTLTDYFSKYGEISDCVIMLHPESGQSRGFGFITFADAKACQAVIETSPHTIDGRTVDPKPAVPRDTDFSKMPKEKKIFVGGIPPEATQDALRDFFNQYGTVVEVILQYDRATQRPRGFGFVTFESEDPIEKLCADHYHEFLGKTIEVKRAQPKYASDRPHFPAPGGFRPRGRGGFFPGSYPYGGYGGYGAYGFDGSGYGAFPGRGRGAYRGGFDPYYPGYGGYGNFGGFYPGRGRGGFAAPRPGFGPQGTANAGGYPAYGEAAFNGEQSGYPRTAPYASGAAQPFDGQGYSYTDAAAGPYAAAPAGPAGPAGFPVPGQFGTAPQVTQPSAPHAQPGHHGQHAQGPAPTPFGAQAAFSAYGQADTRSGNLYGAQPTDASTIGYGYEQSRPAPSFRPY